MPPRSSGVIIAKLPSRPRPPSLPPPISTAMTTNGSGEMRSPPSPSASLEDRDDGQTGKKRKVPSNHVFGRERDECDPTECDHDVVEDDDTQRLLDNDGITTSMVARKNTINRGSFDPPDPKYPDSPYYKKNGKWVISNRFDRTSYTRSNTFRKTLHLTRKAAIINLFLESQKVVTAELKKGIMDKSDKLLPNINYFEKLMPCLEDVGVGCWAMDNWKWRSGGISTLEEHQKSLEEKFTESQKIEGGLAIREGGGFGKCERWRLGYVKKRKLMDGRKKVVRGGWFPEGSFEFEDTSPASEKCRNHNRDVAALAKLALTLRTIVLSAGKATDETEKKPLQPSTVNNSNPVKPTAPIKKAIANNNAPNGPVGKENTADMSKTNSSQGSDPGKKKGKKKKRSVLANQSNPHHVDNYRPSRTISPLGDPLEPYPSHASLLFPPPMRFLSIRPRKKTPEQPEPYPSPIRASEDDFICNFCEYALFFGSEQARRRAIRNRKRELKRKQNIKNRAKNVADGKNMGNLGREDESWDEDDYSGDEDDDGHGHGKCSCGRPLNSKGSRVKKPPDPDGKDKHDHHHHNHDHHHHEHEHEHDHEHTVSA